MFNSLSGTQYLSLSLSPAVSPNSSVSVYLMSFHVLSFLEIANPPEITPENCNPYVSIQFVAEIPLPSEGTWRIIPLDNCPLLKMLKTTTTKMRQSDLGDFLARTLGISLLLISVEYLFIIEVCLSLCLVWVDPPGRERRTLLCSTNQI